MNSKKTRKNELITKILGLLAFWLGIITLVVGFFIMDVNIVAILAGILITIAGLFAMKSPEAWENWITTWFGI